jgi:preprotein translocase subunit SecE
VAKKPVSKKKTSTKSSAANGDNVVRIKAGSSAPKKDRVAKEAVVVEAEPKKQKAVKAEKQPKEKKERSRFNIFAAIGGYFKGAWVELRQVRWPTRRATWSLTGAVLIYSAFFVVLVLLLDAGFKYLFELILGK